MTSVYALVDPRTNEVRYVGISSKPVRRYEQHLSLKRRSRRLYSSRWVQSLLRVGVVPKMEILRTCASRQEAGAIEMIIIKRLREQGVLLTNLSDGGEGA